MSSSSASPVKPATATPQLAPISSDRWLEQPYLELRQRYNHLSKRHWEEVSGLEDEVRELRSNNTQLVSTVGIYKELHQSLLVDVEQLSKENNTLKATALEQHHDLCDEKQQSASLREEVTQLHGAIDSYGVVNASLKQQLATEQQWRVNRQKEIDAIQQQVYLVGDSYTQLQRQLQEKPAVTVQLTVDPGNAELEARNRYLEALVNELVDNTSHKRPRRNARK